jgi:hypothetical protein
VSVLTGSCGSGSSDQVLGGRTNVTTCDALLRGAGCSSCDRAGEVIGPRSTSVGAAKRGSSGCENLGVRRAAKTGLTGIAGAGPTPIDGNANGSMRCGISLTSCM